MQLQPNTPPTILFMGRIFDVPWGGVREMAESLLRALAPLLAQQNRRLEVLVPRAGICPVKSEWIHEVVLPRYGNNIFLWDHLTVSAYANRQPNALLYNIKLVLPEFLRIPGFTSLHDLMYFPQPSKYDWREYLLADSLYMRLFVSRTVRRAHLLHVDSDYTGADARDLFPKAGSEFFRTIHLGVNAERFSPKEPLPGDDEALAQFNAAGLKGPYILHTGGLSKRKNLVVLAKAFSEFRQSNPAFQLVVTGGSKPTIQDPELAEAIGRLSPGSFVKLGAVSSRALELLYQRAWAYVFPSLYEGFGLPVLEAQAAGVPVVCSHATSLKEVAPNGSALLFDPRSVGELVAHVNALKTDSLRKQLIEKGRQNAVNFSWEKTARRWLELADDVYARGPVRSSWFV